MQVSALIKQKSYEKIIFLLHRHPITFVPILGLFLLLILIPVSIYFLITNLYPNILDNQVVYVIAVLFASIYFLSTYLFFYVRFIDYYLDIWIVTNDRIIDIEQHGLFSRVVTELDLFRIQDVTTNVNGFFQTVFRYGDIIVTTASTNTNIIFKRVPEPDKVREELITAADQDRKYHLGGG